MQNALRLHGNARQNAWQTDAAGLCWCQSGQYTPQDSLDAQPLLDGERWAIVFSGLLYHRPELCQAIGIRDAEAARMPDAKLALMAWQKWADGAAKRLYGSFAFIIIDRHENTLFAYRSPLSALPLFYFYDSDRLVLGSAPKVIFSLGDIPREIDEQRIADSLVQNHEETGRSFYRNIRSLPLGKLLIARERRLEIRAPYALEDVPQIRFGRDQDYIEAAQELLGRAIASAMRSADLPAATLSSGLDSSSVTIAALEHMASHPDWNARRLTTFTAVPDPAWDGITDAKGSEGDESSAVRALAAMYPAIDAHFLDCAGLNLDTDLDQLTALAEGPVAAVNNLHWILGINRQVRRTGSNVLLTGVGGSTTITGYGRSLPAMQLRRMQLARLHRSLKGMNNGRSTFGNFISQALRPNMPRSIVDTIDTLKGRLGDSEWSPVAPLNLDYARDMQLSARRRDMMRGPALQARKSVRQENLLLAGRGLRDSSQSIRAALESLTGVQSRDPLGDRKLFAFCMGIPADQFYQNGQPRALVKRMMRGKLPPEIMHARKGRQAADWHVRLTRDLPFLRREVERLADDDEMRRRFDFPRMRQLLDSWPEKTPISTQDHPDFMLARTGLTRVLNTARFINWVKGKN